MERRQITPTIERFVARVATENLEILDSDAQQFIHDLLSSFSNASNESATLLVYSKVQGIKFASYDGTLHSQNSLKFADLLIKELTPNMGLSAYDSYETARSNSEIFRSEGASYSKDHIVNFNTVIPGFYLSYMDFEDNIIIGLHKTRI